MLDPQELPELCREIAGVLSCSATEGPCALYAKALDEAEEHGAERGRREERQGCHDIKLTSERGFGDIELPEWAREAIAARGPMAEEER